MKRKPTDMVTVTMTLGDLEDAHAAHLYVPEWMSWHRSHDGSAHCLCSLARAIRELRGNPHPGTEEYRKLYEVSANIDGNKRRSQRTPARSPLPRGTISHTSPSLNPRPVLVDGEEQP